MVRGGVPAQISSRATSRAVTGRAASLPELPIQYGDFAVWQRAWLQGDTRTRLLDYWRQHLAGVPRMLEMPTDRPRKAVQTYAGADAVIAFPQPVVDGLKALARSEDATLFMVLLAAWQLLLHRYTNQDQIVVSSGVASRDQRETESLIGCLTNIVVMRGDLGGNPSFRTLVRRAREVALGAFSHQALPFEELVKELHPERDLSHPPFSQSMIVLLNAPTEPLNIQGLRVTPIPLESTTTQYDLLFHFWEDDRELNGRLRYSTDLFDRATIDRLLDHFRALIDNVTEDADRLIDDVPMLTAAERHELVVARNATATPFPDRCLHELFEARVDEDPDRLAIISGEPFGDLWRARTAVEPRGSAAARARRWSWRPGGNCRHAFDRQRRWAPGNPQSRWGLSSAGSLISSRASGLHARRRSAARRAHALVVAVPSAGTRRSVALSRRRGPGGTGCVRRTWARPRHT